MTTTTENTTFEERLQARLKQMNDAPTRVYTEEQKECNRQRARTKYACRTEEQKEADRVRYREWYMRTHPHSRPCTKRDAGDANERIAKMVEDSNKDDVTTTEPQPATDNEPQKVLYMGRTEEQRKAHNERERIRYANRTEEEKERDRRTDKEYYHKRHPDAKYIIKRTDEYTYANPSPPQWYVDVCKGEEQEANHD